MQLNPEAALQNNFVGTKSLSKICSEFGVKKFVMLSTDKAVNPNSVMGLSKTLAEKLHSKYTTSFSNISHETDGYFVAVKDAAFEKVLPQINFKNKLLVHCSGSMPLSCIETYSENTGVFYPLQTFSKNREIDFSKIPVFIEANSTSGNAAGNS